MTRAKKGAERRKWQRLPLAIPVFVRGIEPSGRKFIEFATALDISVGGALLAIQRHLPQGSKIMLEIPSSPIPKGKEAGQKGLSAKLVRVTHGEQGQLLGLKFQKPLLNGMTSPQLPAPKVRAKRKSASSV
ncbi:MAG TPA: PilZ domain-containing protein [Terriglobales bacterium]|nr:PilZ domain-containing protein [Terriglobales bacterium]